MDRVQEMIKGLPKIDSFSQPEDFKAHGRKIFDILKRLLPNEFRGKKNFHNWMEEKLFWRYEAYIEISASQGVDLITFTDWLMRETSPDKKASIWNKEDAILARRIGGRLIFLEA